MFEYLFFQLDQLFHLVKEPAVDLGCLVEFVDGRAFPRGFIEHELPGGAGRPYGFHERFLGPLVVALEETQAVAFVFQGTDGFLESFLVILADRHHFADGAHLRSQLVVRAVKLLEGPARELHDHVVAGGAVFVERALFPAGELVKRYAGREVGGDEGDGEARRFGSQGGGAGSSRVDLDDHHAVTDRVVRELDVRAADHFDGVHDVVGIFLQTFLQGFGDRHHRGGAVGVAGVHAHGVDVLDEADRDLLTFAVADDLKLQFFPAGQTFLDQDLVDQAFIQAAVGDRLELFHVVDEAAAGAAHRVGRTDDDRELDGLKDLFGFLVASGDGAPGAFHADRLHRVLEGLSVFAFLDGVELNAYDLHVVFRQDAFLGQVGGKVQGHLTAKIGEQGVGPFLGDDLLERFDVQGLDVGMIGHIGVGHDGGGVGVHQYDLVTE